MATIPFTSKFVGIDGIKGFFLFAKKRNALPVSYSSGDGSISSK